MNQSNPVPDSGGGSGGSGTPVQKIWMILGAIVLAVAGAAFAFLHK